MGNEIVYIFSYIDHDLVEAENYQRDRAYREYLSVRRRKGLLGKADQRIMPNRQEDQRKMIQMQKPLFGARE